MQNDTQHNMDGKAPPIPIQSSERTITFTRIWTLSFWSPSKTEPRSGFDSKIQLDLGAYLTPKFELSLIIFNNVIKMDAGLSWGCDFFSSFDYCNRRKRIYRI